jgi:hypothetical protein
MRHRLLHHDADVGSIREVFQSCLRAGSFPAEGIAVPCVPIVLALIEADRIAAGFVDYVVFEQESLAALIDEHPVVRRGLREPAPIHVVDEVRADDGSGLESQRINSAAIAEPAHYMMDN